MDPYATDLAACRQRQKRLLELMQTQRLTHVIVTQIEHVQYLCGARFHWTFQPAFVLDDTGHGILVGPEKRIPDDVAADAVVTYEARWHSTLRNDQRAESTRVLQDALQSSSKVDRLGVEFSSFTRHFCTDGKVVDIEPGLYQLRRTKDPDELQRIRKAIAGTERMYQTARDMIEPGVNELDIFNALQAAAIRDFGELLTGTGNDYQCASRGGAPRDRKCQAGELYILDLGPAFRGYFADNARTIAVSEPNQIQLETYEAVIEVLDMVEDTVRPGVSARQVFERAQQMLDRCPHGVFNHHLGHGIGLFPHEAPHLNPHWDDTFQVGDVFTAEPGVYSAELNQGMRIENDYLVTESGVERLTNFPLELKL